MQSYILKENVLTDNVLLVADKNKIFKGGYVAIVKENRFLNSWMDKETIKNFRSKDKLMKYLNSNYPCEIIDDLDFTDNCLN